jgi:hypothetical protein
MTESTPFGRREFLAGTAGLLTPGLFRGSAGDEARSADRFVVQSRRLPTPEVKLPTDRLPAPKGRKLRIVALTTAWWKYSHADDIITKFIEGYGVVGRTHLPHCRVVGLYVEQFPKTDISRGMAARYRIPMFKTPADALTLGGRELAADAVLLIGEHGDYPTNKKGQKLYPRRRLFEEIVKVFRKTGRSVPVFNDKHLSYSWKNAEWMHRQSRELKFPMMAGSSVPVTWRRPPLAFRRGVSLNHALVGGSGSFESYGFHCLELLQAFVEKRKGGETGVNAVQAVEGDAADKLLDGKGWMSHLLPAAIAPVPDSRKNPRGKRRRRRVVFRIEYGDGFEAAACLTGGMVSEYCFAAEVDGRSKPVATYAFLPKPQRDHFSFLCNHVESMFRTGKPSYPVERTLLTTGVLDALHDSRAAGGRRVATPHLRDLRYTPAEDCPAAD